MDDTVIQEEHANLEVSESVQQDLKPQEEKKESPAQVSFRQLREKAEYYQRELERVNKEREEEKKQLARVKFQSPEEEEEEDIAISPDDLVEGKHLARYDKKIKKLQQEVRQGHKRATEIAVRSRIKSDMPDFDKIVNEETLYVLQSQYPDLAASINSNPDIYSAAKAAHDAIIKLGLNEGVSSEQESINKNVNKPRPMASIAPQQGDSPLTRANAFANGLTDEIKHQLYEEMKKCANSR